VAVLYNGIILPKAPQLREYPVQEEYGYTETTENSTGSESVFIQISDCWVNPLKYTDPDGREDEIPQETPLPIIAPEDLKNSKISITSNELGLEFPQAKTEKKETSIDIGSRRLTYADDNMSLSMQLDGDGELKDDFGWDKSLSGTLQGNTNIDFDINLGNNIAVSINENMSLTMPFVLKTGNVLKGRSPSLDLQPKKIQFSLNKLTVGFKLSF
jgi:hypothetical protein